MPAYPGAQRFIAIALIEAGSGTTSGIAEVICGSTLHCRVDPGSRAIGK
jgi:hypothetical protein